MLSEVSNAILPTCGETNVLGSRHDIVAPLLFAHHLPSLPTLNTARHPALVRNFRDVCEKPARYPSHPTFKMPILMFRSVAVFKTFEKELRTDPENALKPLERIEVAEGFATPDEVNVLVANRSGSILSASTILKSDLFTNLQKASRYPLPHVRRLLLILHRRCHFQSQYDLIFSKFLINHLLAQYRRIPGAPNFRRLPLILPGGAAQPSTEGKPFNDSQMVCGSGMPTVEG